MATNNQIAQIAQLAPLYLKALSGCSANMSASEVMGNNDNLQEFINAVCALESVDNQVNGYLAKYLYDTRELHMTYQLVNQERSPIFEVWGSDGQIYKVYLRKNSYLTHVCLYISIPADHPLNGKSYDEMDGATFCEADHTNPNDPNRWIFGWDYAHLNDCSISQIYFLAANSPRDLLNLRIVNNELIARDVSHYVEIFARKQLI